MGLLRDNWPHSRLHEAIPGSYCAYTPEERLGELLRVPSWSRPQQGLGSNNHLLPGTYPLDLTSLGTVWPEWVGSKAPEKGARRAHPGDTSTKQAVTLGCTPCASGEMPRGQVTPQKRGPDPAAWPGSPAKAPLPRDVEVPYRKTKCLIERQQVPKGVLEHEG